MKLTNREALLEYSRSTTKLIESLSTDVTNGKIISDKTILALNRLVSASDNVSAMMKMLTPGGINGH